MDADQLRLLPVEEKLRIVKMLWDDLGESMIPIPLPRWIDEEAAQRRAEMENPEFGLSHDEVWQRVNQFRIDDANADRNDFV